MTEWLKVKSGAKYADTSERSFRDWLKAGLRHSRLPSGSIRIKKAWIDEYLAGFETRENRVDAIVNDVLKDF